jgi:predicted nucleotidyltransferase
MQPFIETLKAEIKNEPFVDSVVCFIIFGSYVYFGKDPNDVDICVIVKNRNVDLKLLSNYIYSKFKNPDVTIYFKDELESNIPFTDIGNGVFAIEYLSYGIPLYGDNFFKDLFAHNTPRRQPGDVASPSIFLSVC